MNSEYILLNVLIFIGPLALSFERRIRFLQYWPKVFLSIGIVMIPFLLWDVLVSGAHWHFNEAYTLPYRILKLPIGEWLFFITMPFSCLFVWQIIVTDTKNAFLQKKFFLHVVMVLASIAFFVLFFLGKTYTSLVCLATAITIVLDFILKTNILSQKRTYLFLGIITILVFIFNGYLTIRPVVFYNPVYFSNIRILTVPIEDFFYGYTLILLSIIIFERLKGFTND